MIKVLAGIKVKDSAVWLPRFIAEIMKLKGLSRIAIFYGKSIDATYSILDHWRNISEIPIEIYSDPYFPPDERKGSVTSARVDREFQTLLREGDENYFLKIDGDLVDIPVDMLQHLIGDNKDVVAPYVWTEGRGTKTFFDMYVFRVEGCRFHPFNPPGINSDVPIEVDSVGTCWLAKREVFLKGIFTNPYPQIPFHTSLRNQGFQIWADPTINITHVDLERYGIRHFPEPVPYSMVPFINSKGKKINIEQAQAELYYDSIINYDKDIPLKQRNLIENFNLTRPLITACYKLFNEDKFFKYSLESVYPYVDKIVIVEGAVRAMWNDSNNGSSTDSTVDIIKSFPDTKNKIKLIQGKWERKEEMQAKLLEHCTGKWLMYIDGDEIITKTGGKLIRNFCESNQDGHVIYGRAERFYTFWHDFYHISYSMNPLSPWGRNSFPHALLVWRDLPGLHFMRLHTIPTDGFGRMIGFDHPEYRGREKNIDGLFIYHFGNAKGIDKFKEKMKLPHARLLGEGAKKFGEGVKIDPWLKGTMPDDMVLERFNQKFPVGLKSHPDRFKKRIKIVQTKPVFKFEVI